MKNKILKTRNIIIATLLILSVFLTISFYTGNEPSKTEEKVDKTTDTTLVVAPQTETKKLYETIQLQGLLDYSIFARALKGIQHIKNIKNRDIITIIDFSKPSVMERLFIIDLKNQKLLLKSLVAHGKNSGDNYATRFSNVARSLSSSLGFYVTAETYMGGHGYSLKLDGMEEGFNSNSRARAVVMHGANYVNHQFAQAHGRLGRSWGCPAIPTELSKKIIDLISHGTCLYIHANDSGYLAKSTVN